MKIFLEEKIVVKNMDKLQLYEEYCKPCLSPLISLKCLLVNHFYQQVADLSIGFFLKKPTWILLVFESTTLLKVAKFQ